MKSLWGQGNRYLRVNRKNIEVDPRVAKILVGGLIALIAAVFILGDVGLWNLWRAQKALESVRSEVTRLESETATLRESIELLRSDPFTIEKIARERYGYLRPGDRIYRIITLPPHGENAGIFPTSLDRKGASR